jgi:hypothetical protein
MGLFDDREVYTLTSFICDIDWGPPCGCTFDTPVPYQHTNLVKGEDLGVAECPVCGTTWDDD